MVLDAPDDIVVQPSQGERDDVAEINPDHLDNDAEHENVLLATDCTSQYTVLYTVTITLVCKEVALTLRYHPHFSRGHEGACTPTAARRTPSFRRCCQYLDSRELEDTC